MVSILEKSEHNVNFHPIVAFVEASPLRIETTEEGTKILATINGILRTVTKSSLRRNLKLKDGEGISSLPNAELFENLTLMGYNISPNQKTYNFSKMIFDGMVKNVNNKVNSPSFSGMIVPLFYTMLVPQGEGSGTPTEPHHTPSPEAQHTSYTTNSSPTLPPVTTTPIPTVTPSDTPTLRQYTRRARIAQFSALLPVADEPASPLRDVSEGEACPTDSGFGADQDRANIAKTSTLPYDSAPRVTTFAADEDSMKLKLDELTATILASGVAEVPIGSGSISTAGPPAAEVPTGIDELPTAGLIFATAIVKKKKIQEQIDIQMARQLKEKIERDAQRMNEQIARDEKIVRIHAEEELQIMIDGLDRSNETTQQRKPWSKKQKRVYYMAVIKSNLGWKVKDFRGMTFKENKAKFTTVWKQLEDFIPIGSKEEAERFKRKGIRFDQESVKKLKTSEEVPEEVKIPDEVPEEKVKEMMQNLMHAPVERKLYDMCGVHQVTSKDKEIFMLVEKDYPLRKGLAIVMICYKLEVENYSQMANDLILKIYKIVNCPSQKDD
nr:hypothetical protein [Tanacetum cinerariifolium]